MEFRIGRGWWAVAGAAVLVVACEVPTAPPRFETTFVVPGEAVTFPVTSRTATATTTYDLSDTGDLAGRARSGALLVDVENATNATGQVLVRMTGGGVTVEGMVDLSEGEDQRIPATRAEVQALLGHALTIEASGTLCPASGCSLAALPPFPMVTFETSLELMLELGGES